MNKPDLISAIQHRLESQGASYPKYEISSIVDPLFEIIIDTLQSGEEVQIKNFGRFTLKLSKPRKATHPKTKESIEIPAKATIVFNQTRSFEATDDGLKRIPK